MMMVHPDQADRNCNYSCMTCRDCIKLPLDIDGIDTSIDTHMLKKMTYSSPPIGSFRKLEKARYWHTQERQG